MIFTKIIGVFDVAKTKKAIGLVLISLLLVFATISFAYQAPQYTTRVSTSSSGRQANSWSNIMAGQSISSNGRFIVFKSKASNLVPGDTNGRPDVFVKDTRTGKIKRVSTDSSGRQVTTKGPNGSYRGYISANGRFVVFTSGAKNLVPGDTNAAEDAFVKDTLTNKTTRVSTDSDGRQGRGHSSGSSISADGRYVLFGSGANNLVKHDKFVIEDGLFVKDLQTNKTTLVSSDSNGNPAAIDDCPYGYCLSGGKGPSTISADGRYVAFASSAINLVPGITRPYNPSDPMSDVYIKDLITNKTTRITSNGARFRKPAISGNGRFVVYSDHPYIYVKDRVAGSVTKVGMSNYSSISADGRYVAFNGKHIYVKDIVSGKLFKVSNDPYGNPPNEFARMPSISADGNYISFSSAATNLAGHDTNRASDVFVSPRIAVRKTYRPRTYAKKTVAKRSGVRRIATAKLYWKVKDPSTRNKAYVRLKIQKVFYSKAKSARKTRYLKTYRKYRGKYIIYKRKYRKIRNRTLRRRYQRAAVRYKKAMNKYLRAYRKTRKYNYKTVKLANYRWTKINKMRYYRFKTRSRGLYRFIVYAKNKRGLNQRKTAQAYFRIK